MVGTVLVVEDHERIRRALCVELKRADFQVLEAGDGELGWEQFRRHDPDLVITDLVMPRCDGQAFLERVAAESDVPVLLYSSRANVRSAVDAMKAGATDFLASEDASIEDIVDSARSAILSRHQSGHADLLGKHLVGESPAINQLRKRIAFLAPLRTPVLVLGEAGTGRDTAARLLHEVGGPDRPSLLVVDCELTPDTMPSESQVPVYLREVEHLSLDSQQAWARHLAAELRNSRFSDFRVIASTTLTRAAFESSGIHETLRKVFSPHLLPVPKLQERVGDVPTLANRLVETIAREMGRKVSLAPECADLLEGRLWPGHVRELGDVLSRAVAFSPGRVVQASLLEEILSERTLGVEHFRTERDRSEREQLIAAMRETGGNIKRTAEMLGKSRPAVYRLIKKHQV